MSHQGKFVVTGSHDKSIRIWEKLDEPVWFFKLYCPISLISHVPSFSWKKKERKS